MAFFTSPATKFERAVRAFVFLQGKGTLDDSFIANDSRDRTLPNRTYVASSFSPDRSYRPEGVVTLDIQHHFAAVEQPDQTAQAQRVAMDAFVGDTMDALNADSGNPSLVNLADAITRAGRWLAVTDNTPEGDAIAAANPDMVNFRCDWIKFGQPLISRGKPDNDSSNWVEVIHLSGFVSHAST